MIENRCDSSLPIDFDSAAYLELNPDVASAGMDPVAHYLNHGRLEKRSYKMNGSLKFIYGDTLDFPTHYQAPKKIVCIYFIPRSGSNYLADLLRQTNLLGFPLEYFPPGNNGSITPYMLNRLKTIHGVISKRTSPNGVFSFKWNSSFHSNCVTQDLSLKIKNKITHKIFIDREDRSAQARSYAIAKNNNNWVTVKNQERKIFHVDNLSTNDLRNAENFLSKIRTETLPLLGDNFLNIRTEKLLSDPKSTLSRIFEFCEISIGDIEIPDKSLWTLPTKMVGDSI
ncbi:hypothetical protein [Limnohabitans sp. Jir72]|uniref:hypothetical protein n=1 Tax=Limnohabitans sp. Jir72 TaxID=1977909 RepID=UPI0011B1D3FA|nr:hypothetical protein [Limnohabitans sp. Jir72]